MHDLFASAGRDWHFIAHGEPGPQHFRPYVVTRDGKPVRAVNGVTITPDHALAHAPRPDIVCISDFFIAPGDELSGKFDAEIAWLNQAYADGALVATACAGALILAESGLLDGHDATIHWGYCDAMAKRYPAVRVHSGRTLVVSGPEQRLVMGGGGTTWQDVALYLIGRFLGIECAMQLAKVYLIDWHDVGQLPYSALVAGRQTSDAVIARCQEWLAENYSRSGPVAAMVEMSGLKERSFNRRFVQATGLAPLDYVHALRLEEAKQLLETTPMPVEAVANETGYEDASFFSRLFRRKVGVTPAQYRRRFASLRKALTA
jgi:transcriptional regulator GlxA family with amidase domain